MDLDQSDEDYMYNKFTYNSNHGNLKTAGLTWYQYLIVVSLSITK